MEKQQTIQELTTLMMSIQLAYYKSSTFFRQEEQCGFGRQDRLWVHETGEAGISIDLYDLFDDGLPKCDNLEFDDQTYQQGMPARQHAYCIGYDPDREEHPVLVLCNEAGVNEFDDSFELSLEDVPLKTIQSITAWIESLLPTNENK